ncbi:hypothetical protein [Streptomyces sp. 184]|uniref:hypothetical protein n=1 Tax=Streptomyces sp. 184 TaxID=1827526 RepID=UPI00389277AE
MDVNGTGALVVAVVAVIGTLSSALLTERAAERSRIREQERIEQARAWAEEAGVRRACCVALNAASRQYLAALTDQLYALLRSEDPSAARQRLTEARDVHRGVYAEAQLLLPDPVLAQAGEVTHALGTCYGRLRRLDDGVPRRATRSTPPGARSTRCGTNCGSCGAGCGRTWQVRAHRPGRARPPFALRAARTGAAPRIGDRASPCPTRRHHGVR